MQARITRCQDRLNVLKGITNDIMCDDDDGAGIAACPAGARQDSVHPLQAEAAGWRWLEVATALVCTLLLAVQPVAHVTIKPSGKSTPWARLCRKSNFKGS